MKEELQPFSVRLDHNEHRKVETLAQAKKWSKGFVIKQAIDMYYEIENERLQEINKFLKKKGKK